MVGVGRRWFLGQVRIFWVNVDHVHDERDEHGGSIGVLVVVKRVARERVG